nr:Conserved hypothetical protein [Methylocystis sp. SC2]
MQKVLLQSRLVVTLALWLGLNGAAVGDDAGKSGNDHDIALRAFEHGEVLPLESVLSEVRKAVRGEVVGIELEQERGNWVYQIKVIAPGSSMVEMHVDARTARIFEIKGK